MLLLFEDKKGQWHLVRTMNKQGLASIGASSYCGHQEAVTAVHALPDAIITRACQACQDAWVTLTRELTGVPG